MAGAHFSSTSDVPFLEVGSLMGHRNVGPLAVIVNKMNPIKHRGKPNKKVLSE